MIELTVPVCTVHQMFQPCPPCAKQRARLRRQNWTAMTWMLIFAMFFASALWFAVGGR